MMRQSPSLSYTDFLRSIDARSPVSSEFRIRTVSGAAMSVLTLLLALHLTYSEYSYNLSTTFLDHVRVVDQSPDGLEVSFDVTFHHIPCALLAADANDPAGQSQSFHIDGGGGRHRVWKNRIDGDGRRMGRKSKFDLGGTLTKEDQVENLRLAKEGLAAAKTTTTTTTTATATIAGEGEGEEAVAVEAVAEGGSDDDEADDEQECGSCYGAGDGGECCNTCDDVKRAYHRKHWHVPDLTAIVQCAHMKRAKDEGGEGCNVHGFVALGTGGGNLHFAPDRQWEKEGDVGSDVFGPGGMVNLNAIMQMFDEAFEQFNVSHTVNHLSFGPSMPPSVRRALNLDSQLDGASRTVSDGYGMFQYYLQVVPTVFRFLNGTVIETFQYSVTEHTRHVDPGSGRGLPGVFFFYEVSALHVEFEEYRRGWTHFLTGACAAVGGAFTVMGMLDRGVFEWRAGRGGGNGVGGGSLLA